MYQFSYQYNELILDTNTASLNSNITTGVMLIHPIGVGIGKWYYDRLMSSLSNSNHLNQTVGRIMFVAPDLGSGSATAPTHDTIDGTKQLRSPFPLLNITDWSNQITTLMAEYESKSNAKEESSSIQNWVIVTNGGCSPIALQVAQSSVMAMENYSNTTTSIRHAPVTHVILSSPPRLPFFLQSTDLNKVHKSYRTLSRTIVGKLFWWYALRKNGRFLQKFSERNLVGDANSLGEEWTPNCLATAKQNDGRSRYSTFAFLAGALQDGCVKSLTALRGSNVKIDFIRGRDVRRNRAKSWFWSRQNKTRLQEEDTHETIQEYIDRNGNRGREVFVDGRISLAWEDADGYAKSIIELMSN
eukprot:scaffold36296_cov115-Cyclotella_meneghiniana.AAC.6